MCCDLVFAYHGLMIANVRLLLQHYQGWTFLEGVYFWFVTFSTIGFGDYVAVVTYPRSIKQLSCNSSTNRFSGDGLIYARESTAINVFHVILGSFLAIVNLCSVSSVVSAIMAAIEERKCYTQCIGCVLRETQNRVGDEQRNCSEQRDTGIADLSMENVGFQNGQTTTLSVTEISEKS